MQHMKRAISLIFFWMAAALQLYGQAAGSNPKPQPDVLILVDGEKLIGHLESAKGSTVTFESDIIGEVNVDWSEIQEIHSSQEFAAIPKDAKLERKEDAATIPQGTIAKSDQQLEVARAQGSPQSIPIGNVGNLVDEPSFQKAFERPSFFQGWRGGATAGFSLTQATQKDRSFTAVVNFDRAVPAETWLSVKRRTIFNYNQAYSKLSQPSTPAVKTSLYHFGLEQDWYLNPRLFVFAHGLWDHNFSQGLDLQQTYGGGLGWVAFKREKQELDFKASVDYIDQRFTLSSLNKQLIGSTFGETYIQTFANGIQLNEGASITPAWNDTSAYSALGSLGLTFPVYHHFGFSLGVLDNFLNNPPPGFKKNSLQVTAGLTYSLQ
jgi:putative salt-induced outer membrane protein YdiY